LVHPVDDSGMLTPSIDAVAFLSVSEGDAQ